MDRGRTKTFRKSQYPIRLVAVMKSIAAFFLEFWESERKNKNRKKFLKNVCIQKMMCYHIKALSKTDGALEKRLTHMPFTHAFTGSNPVRVTIENNTLQE